MSPESLDRATRSLSSGGMTRRTAWGSTTCRSACARVSPSDRAAATCDGCTDSMPARKTSATYAEYVSTSASVPSATADVGMPCSRRPGSPNPTSRSTRISGRPRNTST